MRKESLIIAISVLFYACGSNAENNSVKEVESILVVQPEIEQENLKESEEEIIELFEDEKADVKDGNVVLEEKFIKEEKETLAIEGEIENEELVTEIKAFDVEKLMLNHENWNALLKQNVTAAGKVNYKKMKAALPKIKTYLDYLKNNTPKKEWSKNEKLAYWINLYNASTVYLIASNYPTSSITKLNGGKPWDKKFVKSGDKVYSLNQIENEIVRPRFKDSRIHAALNCAAVSCPNLLNEAFTADMLNIQLNKQVKVWVDDVSKNKLEDNKVKISQIFDWYKADFKSGGGVVAFINKYATTKVSAKAKVSYLEYNWALNE